MRDKKINQGQGRLVAFRDTCYSIAKTMFGGGFAAIAFKAMLAPDFTAAHAFGAVAVFALALFFLLLGLLADD